ncbi:MAG TPA: hypothetical protein VF498_12305 [Anaerolineales bacterium]
MNQLSAEDLAFLRHFEPVVRYTRGEHFFPIQVECYIQQCSLWVQRPDKPPELLVPCGELTIEKLIEPRHNEFGSVYFMRLIDPMDVLDLTPYSLNQAVKSLTQPEEAGVFKAGSGRLARVGYVSRLLDALFSVTLYLRGRVPGDSAAAASLTFKQIMTRQECYTYYGRVLRESGWVILQYWYFYPFNNWRSGFYGGNDHEADWEMVCIYCSDEAGAEEPLYSPGDPLSGGSAQPACRLTPRWLAYASHDFSGDDLRRSWDDPEVEKVGEHPVIYAGAGSHASYFAPGEYLAEVEIPYLTPLVRLANKVQDIWLNTFHQGSATRRRSGFNVFKAPFVDYARGDGLSIGPGEKQSWQICPLDDTAKWALQYRGLWGFYARDPTSSENAPAGPVYKRDGSVRRSWYDPIGWAGLDKVPPPSDALSVLTQQRAAVQKHKADLENEISNKSAELVGLGIEATAMEGKPHLEKIHEDYTEKITALSRELSALHGQQTVDEARLEALDQYETRLQRGETGPLRAHIRRPPQPSTELDLRLGKLAEGFAAVSIGLVMIGIVLLIGFARHYLVFGLGAMIGLLIFVEAGFQRRLSQLITSLVIGLAMISAAILVYQFFWDILVATVIATGLYIMWENIREIRN